MTTERGTDIGAPSVGAPAAGLLAAPATGLSASEVAERVRNGEVNVTSTRGSRSVADIVRANVVTSFNIVIGSMWLLMILAGAALQDSLFGLVIIINSGIGIFQELRAKRTLDRLSLVGEAHPVVIRDGVPTPVRPREVVLGDVIELDLGDQLVVDGQMLTAAGLEIDESLLTGEADPVHKAVGDRVLSGSFVVAGSGRMEATAVGDSAYAASIADEVKAYQKPKSELLDSIMRFVRTITWVLIPLGTLLFISQLEASPDWRTALTGTVAGVVTMVPEGLVLLTSVAMAVAVVRLGQQKALVQEMPAVETLARVDVVCVDKTGTLTEPGMQVQGATLLGPGPGGRAADASAQPTAQAALGALGGSEPNPNPTLAAIADAYPQPSDPAWAVQGTVPFSSARKWSAVETAGQGWWMLGAPEMLLGDADPGVRSTADELASGGARVLLLAAADTAVSAEDPVPPVRPVALVEINQTLRSDAADTVSYFLDQGVRLIVISGDNPTTVGAIAAHAGIPGATHPVDARELPEDADELAALMDAEAVFGRVSPTQKRSMVKALQSRGHVVAMTGDGVNDVLALKDADLGIAMGSGADATRSVAQLVLLDDKFSVLPGVVAEGRRVLGNIERVSDLFLTKSFYSAVLSLLVVFVTLTNIFQVEFVFLPRHLTVITWLTIGAPAFLLALMPNNQRFRPGFFRRVLSFALPAGIACGAFSFGTYVLVLAEGKAIPEARVAAAITLFLMAITVLALVAMPWNPLRVGIVAVMAAGFLAVLFIPPLSRFFALQLAFDGDGTTAVLIGLAGAVVIVLIRRVSERYNASRSLPVT